MNRETVSEQLVYEIGDPAHYLTPDVDVDFTTLELAEQGPDRMAVRKATGRPATDTYKVSLAYKAGYMASSQLLVYGRDCQAKARSVCRHYLRTSAGQRGYNFPGSCVEMLGIGDGVLRAWSPRPAQDLREGGAANLSAACQSRRRRGAIYPRSGRPLATAGPAGLAGYTGARGWCGRYLPIGPRSCPKELVPWQVQVRTADEWRAVLMNTNARHDSIGAHFAHARSGDKGNHFQYRRDCLHARGVSNFCGAS